MFILSRKHDVRRPPAARGKTSAVRTIGRVTATLLSVRSLPANAVPARRPRNRRRRSARPRRPIISQITPGSAIIDHQKADHEGRHHSGAAAERVADAVGAQPDLGREQFGRIDAEQDRGLDIDRDDQHGADAQHHRRIGRGAEMRVDPAGDDGQERRADDAPAPADGCRTARRRARSRPAKRRRAPPYSRANW